MKPITVKEKVFPKDYPELRKMSNSKNIICVCYCKAFAFPSRKDALAYYREGAKWSEGSERDRYVNICLALIAGETFAADDIDYI